MSTSERDVFLYEEVDLFHGCKIQTQEKLARKVVMNVVLKNRLKALPPLDT